MTLERRHGKHPGLFSMQLRAKSGGGTIPDEWACRLVDLDELYLAIGETAVQVRTEGRIWAWWAGAPLQIVAIAEKKTAADLQQSWVVTEALAHGYGAAGFRIVGGYADGHVEVSDLDHRRETYPSLRDFVEARIRPLVEQVAL